MKGEGIPHKLLKMKKYIVCILWLLLVVGVGQSGAHARSGRVTTIYGKIRAMGSLFRLLRLRCVVQLWALQLTRKGISV